MSSGYTIRKHLRFSASCPVYYMGPYFLGKGHVSDCSLAGWRIEGDQFVYPGLILTLGIFVPDEPKAIRVKHAVVRWSKEESFGVQILVIENEESERLRRAVIRLVQQQFSLAQAAGHFRRMIAVDTRIGPPRVDKPSPPTEKRQA